MIILMLRMIVLTGQDDGSWCMAHGSRLMAHGEGGLPCPGAQGSAPRSGPEASAAVVAGGSGRVDGRAGVGAGCLG